MECIKVDLNDPELAGTVLDLLGIYARDEMGGSENLSEYSRQNLIQELIKRPYAHVFIARKEGKPAGLAICFESFSTFKCKSLLNIHDLVVVPEFRREGICRLLMNTIEEFSRGNNYCKITLEVLEGNEVAKKTYLSLGFEGYTLGDPFLGEALFWHKLL